MHKLSGQIKLLMSKDIQLPYLKIIKIKKKINETILEWNFRSAVQWLHIWYIHASVGKCVDTVPAQTCSFSVIGGQEQRCLFGSGHEVLDCT